VERHRRLDDALSRLRVALGAHLLAVWPPLI
jgi:hypothetical protein